MNVLAPPPSRPATEAGAPVSARPSAGPAGPTAIALAVLGVLAYAAFARGATALPDSTWTEVALAAVALVAAVAWAGSGPRVAASRTGVAGLALLAAFAAWSGLSLLWTVAPQDTWLSTNEALGYALAVALGIGLGATRDRPVALVAVGWLVVGAAVALYALGGKLAPGLHVDGLFHLNHTAVFSRLRAPLDYWNALALSCVLAVPVAVRCATDATRALRARLGALAVLQVLLVVCGLTYSRGGIVALVVTAIALTALPGPRLRGLAVLGMAAAAAGPALAFSFSSSFLTHDFTSLSSRASDGRLLAVIELASLALLLAAARRLAGLEHTVAWGPERSRAAWRVLGALAGMALVAGIVALAVSPRGLSGSISHQVDTFTGVRRDPITDPSRLLSTSSGNRWVWWREAVGAFSDRPVKGWGAGSFPVTHLLYRKPPPLPVRQPHSVPLQWLAETGLVGFALGVGAIACLLASAFGRVRSLGPGRERDLAAAAATAGLVWAVHGLFDWDWDIPGVTLPALVLLGVLAGRAAAPAEVPALERRGGAGTRTLAVAPAALLLCAFAVSALLPAWSHAKALDAITSVSGPRTPGQLQQAAADADLAARLDPLDATPLIDAAIIAGRRGNLVEARADLIRAVRRDPYDAQGWARLAEAALLAGDGAGAARAGQQYLDLDPLSENALITAGLLGTSIVDPAGSATATGTPLPQPSTAVVPPGTPPAAVGPAGAVAPGSVVPPGAGVTTTPGR